VSKIIGHVKLCAEGTNKKGKKNPIWVPSNNKCKQYDLQSFKFSGMFHYVDWNLSASILVEHSSFNLRVKQLMFDPEEGGITLLQYIGNYFLLVWQHHVSKGDLALCHVGYLLTHCHQRNVKHRT
jgi:hypothetical protein